LWAGCIGTHPSWCILQTDIDERKRAEGLLAGEDLVLKMSAKGSSLKSILEAVYQSSPVLQSFVAQVETQRPVR
jgi:hypothetical protein